jgi:hypothetical protein
MSVSRRSLAQWLAVAPLLAATPCWPAADQQTELVGRLIAEARSAHPHVPQRIDAISRALLGVRYEENTLIGGPDQPEQFVVRVDAFDCVTYCEVVLAAALANNLDDFTTLLRTIRYRRGQVRWDERNHYFAEWCRHAVENRLCRPIAVTGTVTINKDVNFGNLGRRQVSIAAVPRAALMANGAPVATGDIIGFVSQRLNLDFFHTGLLIVGPRGELLLRHASQSRQRVINEPLGAFVTVNRVQYVTLLRPLERAAVAG